MMLDAEIQTYRSQLPELLANEGKFVLVHGGDIVGVFKSREAALVLGYERFKLAPFLVKRIQRMKSPLPTTGRRPTIGSHN